MKATYDAAARAHYVHLTERPVSRTVELSDSVMVDLDENGDVVGVEVLEHA
jgi:uncharacterized protein YuzE